MPKIEDILKAKGLSDADIAAMSTMLANPAYRTALEASYSELESERDTYKQRDAEWQQNLDTTYTPAITRAEQDAQQARLELAAAQESLRIAKDYGYLPDGDAQAKADAAAKAVRDAAKGPPSQGFNLNDPEFGKFANQFSMREGDAMARYNFVSEEYRLLNGGTINDYVGRDGKRGMVAIRAEALAAKQDIDVYANTKFNWDGKRAEQEAKRRADHDAEVGRKAVEEWALKHGNNPMTSAPNPSRMPMMPARTDNGKIVQPWERATATAERRQRAYENETKARVN